MLHSIILMAFCPFFSMAVLIHAGYTALGVALALPADGKLHALDLSEEYASIGDTLSPVQAGILSHLHIDAGLATIN